MEPQAMEPYGMALLSYFEGNINSELIIRRDDDQKTSLPVSIFFREPPDFFAIDKVAIDLCKGHVLDVGAGTGIHSLVLQHSGLPVTAIDISPHAVKIMKQRDLKDVRCTDIFKFTGGPFDTMLIIGRGIGMVQTIDGLDPFLDHAHTLLSKEGQILLNSLDVRVTDDPENLAYQEANRCAGRYVGEIRMQFEFQGTKGPFCGWLQVDAETLSEHAGLAGWQCEVVHQEKSGDYLARLTKSESTQ